MRNLIAALLILVAAAPGRAATSLYTGEVPVTSQAEDERAGALRNALAQVVVKVTGDPGAAARPEVAKAIAGADRFVQQYQYSRSVIEENGQPQVRLILIAQFDRDAIDKLLGEAGAARAGGDAAPAAAETQQGTYRVWVSGINSAEDYARLIGTLSRNEIVRSVQAEQARNDGVQLKLDIAGPLSRLLDSLAAGPVHVVNAKPPVDGVDALLSMQP